MIAARVDAAQRGPAPTAELRPNQTDQDSLPPYEELDAILHGFLIVPVLVGIESMGIPAPGETALVTAAIFAGTTHRLNIALVIALAAAGAIVGDNIGYALGRRYGYGLMMRYRYFLHLDAGRIKLGQYLFARHGGKVVFFGRFVALLRALAAVLAGVNGMWIELD